MTKKSKKKVKHNPRISKEELLIRMKAMEKKHLEERAEKE